MNRIKPRNEKKNPIAVTGLTLLVMYAVSGLLLLILSVLLYNFELSEETVRIGVIVIYIASVVLIINFIVDLLYQKVDPRIRLQ